MRIFYQIGSHKMLRDYKGDHLTEIGIATALSQFAEVYYSGTLFRPDQDNYGLVEYPSTVKQRMLAGEYDIYYVRANKDLFLSIPEGKPCIWMASPYSGVCYRRATAIATFTDAWTKGLQEGAPFSWIPEGERGRCWRNVVTIHQVVGDHFKPRHDSHARKIRKEIGGNFVVGCFGRLVNTNYPYALVRILPQLVKKYPGLRFLFGLGRVEKALPSGLPRVTQTRFSQQRMPCALSACDAVLVSSWGDEWEICGSLKVLEAAACGIPVLVATSAARRELFGKDYPYFLPPLYGNTSAQRLRKKDDNAVYAMMTKVIENTDLRRRVSQELLEKVKFYSVTESAKRLELLFRRLLK